MLIIVFTIGTMIAVTGTNITTLAIGRMIQGVCAGAIQPLVLVTVFGDVRSRTNAARRWVYSGWPLCWRQVSVPRSAASPSTT